ncbi:phosphoribosylamine--glycine ligase [Saccharicrinis carchari]|uniref:Phosphoribosylamine--glycine ligase n=1 Tax=Saccharicrinis carchari TaxID=1168039 RepID=A0A521CL14_SACCC|nr:phosphoribosylamine--glycine ligase [Saccharicrinis carchari]SMO60132.1 phosphoribosylamine--glycine ligase [Saccharicrinis carchari]
MNVLLLGSGGREHALAWKLKQSPKLKELIIAPGNAGTAQLGTNIDVDPNNFDAVKEIALSHNIDMLVVGPEEPLVRGVKDFFLNDPKLAHISVIGPGKRGARLEGSKEFSKDFMLRYGIPTAKYTSVTLQTMDKGIAFLEKMKSPYVLKADGLAAGKGVLIIDDLEQAKTELKTMLEGKFGQASQKVVIEEFLDGIELSVFVLTDGSAYVVFPEAKDYKRIGEGDKGLNTGGMGAVSPVSFADEAFMKKVHRKIIRPTITGLYADEIPYKGFIFIGIIKVDNKPYVIEYNVRLGDPETEVILPRVKGDLLELLEATAAKELRKCSIEFEPDTVTTVVTVSGGYPDKYEKGKEITGLDKLTDGMAFHAGTKLQNGKVLTNGGRVMALSAYGKNRKEALAQSYKNAAAINYEGIYYRKDIGFDL